MYRIPFNVICTTAVAAGSPDAIKIAPPWSTTGIQSGALPDGLLLADTGALPAAVYEADIHIENFPGAIVQLQQRDAANAVTVNFARIRLGTGEYKQTFRAITLTAGERLRVVLDGAVVGEIKADLFVLGRPYVFKLP